MDLHLPTPGMKISRRLTLLVHYKLVVSLPWPINHHYGEREESQSHKNCNQGDAGVRLMCPVSVTCPTNPLYYIQDFSSAPLSDSSEPPVPPPYSSPQGLHGSPSLSRWAYPQPVNIAMRCASSRHWQHALVFQMQHVSSEMRGLEKQVVF